VPGTQCVVCACAGPRHGTYPVAAEVGLRAVCGRTSPRSASKRRLRNADRYGRRLLVEIIESGRELSSRSLPSTSFCHRDSQQMLNDPSDQPELSPSLHRWTRGAAGDQCRFRLAPEVIGEQSRRALGVSRQRAAGRRIKLQRRQHDVRGADLPSEHRQERCTAAPLILHPGVAARARATSPGERARPPKDKHNRSSWRLRRPEASRRSSG
jgi:hypothetical protein